MKMLRVFAGSREDKLGLGASRECVAEICKKCEDAKNMERDELDELRKKIIPAELKPKKFSKDFNAVNVALDKERAHVRKLEDECMKKGHEDDDYQNAVYAHDAHNRRLIEIVHQSFDREVPKKHWAVDLTVLNKML
jgi:hypothetical protein